MCASLDTLNISAQLAEENVLRARFLTLVGKQNKLRYNGYMKKKTLKQSSFVIEFERETDKRWIAEIPKLPGVMAYGATKGEAKQKVFAVALRTI